MTLVQLKACPGIERSEVCAPGVCGRCGDIFIDSNRVIRTIIFDPKTFYSNIVDIAAYAQLVQHSDPIATGAFQETRPYKSLYRCIHEQPGVGELLNQIAAMGTKCYSSGIYSNRYLVLREAITSILPMSRATGGHIFFPNVLLQWDQACEDVKQFTVKWKADNPGKENTYLRTLHRVQDEDDEDDHADDRYAFGSHHKELDDYLKHAHCNVAGVFDQWIDRTQDCLSLFEFCLKCADKDHSKRVLIMKDVGTQVTLEACRRM